MILLAQVCGERTDQVQDAGRGCLVLSTLGEEQKTLAGLVGPGSVGMCNFGFFRTEIGVESVCLEGFIAKPEETL